MSGQSDSDTGTNLLPDLYGFVRIWFQINRFFVVVFFGKVCEFYSQTGRYRL